MAWPAFSGRSTMYTYRCSASSHTASVSCGKKVGGEPSSRSYHFQRRRVVGDRDSHEQVELRDRNHSYCCFNTHEAITNR
jgi:hypothetical protein